MSKKLLITDLDGTLYDWIGYFVPSFYAMVDKIVEKTDIDKETILDELWERHRHYNTVECLYAIMEIPSLVNLKDKGLAVETMIDAVTEYYSARERTLKLYPGVKGVLKTLYKNDIIIVGHTESQIENALSKLEFLDILKYFKYVYSPSSSGFLKSDPTYPQGVICPMNKPSKDAILKICSDNGINPRNAVYVGDNPVKDIYAAGSAGVTSVLLERKERKKEREDLWNKLVRVSFWTDEEFEKQEALCNEYIDSGIKPDYVINSFSKVSHIVLSDGGM